MHRRGTALIYLLVVMTALVAFASLAIDMGRVNAARTKAKAVTDFAARSAATGLADSTFSSRGIATAANNTIDGVSTTITASDIVPGIWNSSAKVFVPTYVSPNAVKVTIRRTAADGNAIPLTFARLIGMNSCDVTATSIAYTTTETSTTYTAPATGNPWLAGMPPGTTGNSADIAPANSPTQAPMALSSGKTLQFNFSGQASNGPGFNPNSPDGNLQKLRSNNWGNEHGIANVTMPSTAVVAVFLDDSQPDSTPAPDSLDFSTASQRDFASISPKLKQPFFIGDGLREDGTTLQNFIVPAGATRLYLGIMDGFEWSNNSGGYTATVVKPAAVSLVK